MQDTIANSNANAAIQKAQLDYQQEIVGAPMDKHASILQKHVNIAKSSSGQQKMTNDARKLMENKLSVWGNTFTETGELATVKAMERDAIIRVSDDYGDALVNGNGEDIAEAHNAMTEQFAISYTPAEAEKQIDKIGELAVKQMKANAVSEIQELAARTPNAVIDRIKTEQELRKTKEPEDFPMLTSKDLEAARDYAVSIGEKAKDDSAQLKGQVITDNYVAIANGAVDTQKMIEDIAANPNLTGDDKAAAIEKTRTFFTGYHSTAMANKAWPLVDDDPTLQALTTTLTEQSSGSIDINEANDIINKAANDGKLTKATRDSLRAKSAKGGNDAIDRSTSAFTSRVRNALTGRFSDRVARAKVREAAVGLAGLSRAEKNEIQTANYLLSVSFDQLHRYSADLDAALREVKGGRETVSGVEATAIAAAVWDKYKTKTTAQRINEFQAFTGQRAPQPEGFSSDVWNSATNSTKSKIVAAMERGLSAKEVEVMVSK
jgi:hypothetical protein